MKCLLVMGIMGAADVQKKTIFVLWVKRNSVFTLEM